ncbi:hypothetical protein [Planococcus sp. YIM B11945]|uniref:hypothetical protein n=1 Tax=Planococcus sp. YIM B11945 TaxID=3435410 RepID=UPI003D7EECF9
MPQKRLTGMLVLAAVALAGCMPSPEEQISDGLVQAKKAFEQAPMNTNETVEGHEMYLPGGYTVEEPSDDQDIIITKGSDSFALSINPNEKSDSTFFYELQKAAADHKWLVDETFEQNGRFGFTTVRAVADGRYEITENAGGVKMTTVAEEGKLRENMDWMMKTVRSITSEE